MAKITDHSTVVQEANSDDIKSDLDTIAAAEATGNGILANILTAFTTLATAICGATAKSLYDLWVSVTATSLNTKLTTSATADVGPKTGGADMTGPNVTISALATQLYLRLKVVVTGTLTVATAIKLMNKDPNGNCSDTQIGGGVLSIPATAGTYDLNVPIDVPGAATTVYYLVSGTGETWSSSNYVTVSGSIEGRIN